MHYSSWLTLAFSASAIARPEGVIDQVGTLRAREVQDIRNLPAIKSTFETLIKDGDALEKAIQPLTKANGATQVNVIIKALDKLSSDTSAQAAAISKSGAIGLLEISGLLQAKNQQVWKDLNNEFVKVLNQTSMDIVAKKDITMALPAAQLTALTKSIKAQKKSIMEIVAVIPGQIPPAVSKQIENGIAKGAAGNGAPPPKMPNINDPEVQKRLGGAVDAFLDQVVSIVSGKQEAFQLPPGVNLPNGFNFPAVVSTEAAAPAAAAPAAAAPAAAPPAAAAPAAAAPAAAPPAAAIPPAAAAAGAAGMAAMPGMAAAPKASTAKGVAPKAPAKLPAKDTAKVPPTLRF